MNSWQNSNRLGNQMNPWQKRRKKNKWKDGLVHWVEDNTVFISVVFSWNLPEAYQKAIWFKSQDYQVIAGGPAVAANPDYLSGVCEIGNSINALPHHNPDATFTSRGCIRKCKFCIVPKIEGELVELIDWEPKPIVCDNNLLACSKRHFDKVIDRLKPIKKVDFNQGLDARLLTNYHAQRLTELDLLCVRLAWDNVNDETLFCNALALLKNQDIPSKMVRIYILIGFNDTPEDALYRLKTTHSLGAKTFPMRYQSLDSKRKNEHIGKNWTHQELMRYMRYWCNVDRLGRIPFEVWDNRRLKEKQDERQLSFIKEN